MLPFIQSSYLTTLLESLNAGVVIMNIRGDVYAVNETAVRLLGVPRESLLRLHFNGSVLDRFPERPEVEYLLTQAREHEATAESLQTRFKHPVLGVRHYTLSVSRIVDYGKVFGIVLQVSDVTHIYEMHEREKRMLEERSALQQERIDSLAQLSMAIAHQIRNPMMTIGGFARILEKKYTLDEAGVSMIQGIREGATRLENVVTAVTQYTATRIPECRETDMGLLVGAIAEGLDPLPAGVSLDIGRDWPVWFLDPFMTSDALCELVQNAVEACAPQGGTVSISWREEDGACVLMVRDHGRGIDAEVAPFLFDPFFTTKSVGVGMGLAKARRWIREQGGELSVSAASEGGTLAVFRIPRACGLKDSAK
jgi:PAS domain S-box-containing protein